MAKKRKSKASSSTASTEEKTPTIDLSKDCIYEKPAEYVGSMYLEKDDSKLVSMTESELEEYIDNELPAVYQLITPFAFQCINTAKARKLMSAEEIETFHNNWLDRIDLLRKYHRHSLAIIMQRYPEEYQEALTERGVDLSWDTMMKRFSTDVYIYADKHKTFFDRMFHYITRNKPTKSLKRARDNGGDDNDDDDDDNDSDVCDITPKRSKSEAKAKENRTPASRNKKKQKTKQANDSSSLASSSSSASSSMLSSASSTASSTVRDLSISAMTNNIEGMKSNMNSIFMNTIADKEHIDKLFQIQAELNAHSLLIWEKMCLRTIRASDQVNDLHRHYVSINQKLDELARNSFSIIDTLYHSYLQMAIELHSREWCRDKPNGSDEYDHRVHQIINSIHPQPIAVRDGNYIFGRHEDVMRKFRLHIYEDVETAMASDSLYDIDNDSISVFRFSDELRRRLQELGKVPSNGNIFINQVIPDPATHKLFAAESSRIMADDSSFLAFNQNNDQLCRSSQDNDGGGEADNNVDEEDAEEGDAEEEHGEQ